MFSSTLKIRRNHILISFILFINSIVCAAEPQIIYYHQFTQKHNNEAQQYYSELLKLALTETISEYGAFELRPRFFPSSQSRKLKLLNETDLIDVYATMTSVERENELRAIYFPLLKGLMGYRVLVVNKKNKEITKNITNIDELKALILGQGLDWPDSQILKENHLNVMIADANKLYKMLVNNRFDAFPRSVTEAWAELKKEKDLTVECCLLLRYISPLYFFVKKDNIVLAERLSKGLRIALSNGKLDLLFYKYRAPQEMFNLIKFKERTIINLQNPNLSDKTKSLLSEPSLWFFPHDITDSSDR